MRRIDEVERSGPRDRGVLKRGTVCGSDTKANARTVVRPTISAGFAKLLELVIPVATMHAAAVGR